jgi:photosystem II stability/assembly factor-like uncharacterized protein
MSDDDDLDLDLDTLLRQPVERLSPPEGIWEQVSRRARRRRWAKAGLGVAASVVVVAGALPAVIAVRHDSSDQSLRVQEPSGSRAPRPSPSHSTKATESPRPSAVTAPAVPTGPAGFTPTSVSFVSQTVGWLWGSTTHFGHGVVAQTRDGGQTWSAVGAPPVDATDPGGSGDYGIRFANGELGYVYGTKLFLTADGGRRWAPVALPGRVVDLETMNHRVWALVRPCTSCATLRLYGASTLRPQRFRPVPGVPDITASRSSYDGEDGTIAVAHTAVYVMVGSSALWTSPDGMAWTHEPDPCTSSYGFADALSAWTSNGLVAVCGGQPSAGSEPKRVFESLDSGTDWSALPSPPTAGYPTSVSAGSAADVIVGLSRGPGYATNNAGRTWSSTRTRHANLSFAGYISDTRIVGVPSSDTMQRAFLSSDDAGRDWSLTAFPK